MDGPIVSKDTIFEQARTAAELGQNVHVANPYPPMSAAHAAFERAYWAWVKELEAVA
ncbi:hypothetical protein [Rhodoferax sp. GW822-FHT02A01]|uniref:hypothetical protein n=1 Tax=Rhodoferax sp. GW822-FHT02A01 TaxID=3141537 RepID=UPI00315C9844